MQEFDKYKWSRNNEYKQKRISDREAITLIKGICPLLNTSDIQNIEKTRRDEVIVKIKEIGISIRQIERITGMSRGIIYKAKSGSADAEPLL